MKIILASKSPRRNAMLEALGIPFVKGFVQAHAEKNCVGPGDDDVFGISVENALQKVRFCRLKPEESGIDSVVIGVDTIVVSEGEILPKPSDMQEARLMLTKLSGKTHHVVSGIALLKLPENIEITAFEDTAVTFRDLSPPEIDLYLSTGESFDKAGAYGIQGYAAFFVEKIEGDYNNVVGLPLVKLYRLLKEAGVDICEISLKNAVKDSE